MAYGCASSMLIIRGVKGRNRLAGTVLAAAIALGACGGGSSEQVVSEPAEPATTSAVATSEAVAVTTAATAASGSTVAEDPPAATTATVAPEEPVETPTTAAVAETTEATEAAAVPETTQATEPVAVPEGPPVPALTLELEDGTTFVTTEATRPVLYLFWAEW